MVDLFGNHNNESCVIIERLKQELCFDLLLVETLRVDFVA